MKSSFAALLLLFLTGWIPAMAQQDTSSSPSGQSSTPAQTTGTSSDQSSPAATPAANQEENANQQTPTYRVTVVQRTTQAVDYRDRGGTTQVDFKGTSLTPQVTGDAKVTGHTGRLAIDASLHHLAPPRSFGPEYLTYVLWAITPEGRPSNLGEVIPNDDGNSRVQVTTGLQEFGLIVTAEPYFAVSRPSNLVVAENIVRNDTAGGIHPIDARFDLLQRGQYTLNVPASQLPATGADPRVPLQLLEAENAIAIAQAEGAGQYAADTLDKAKAFLAQGQDYYRRKQGITPIGAVARAATQSAEDARLLTLEKKQQEATAAERQRAQDRIQQAQTQAEQEAARAAAAQDEAKRQADQRALAEQERQAAEQARLQAEQAAQQAVQDRAAAQQQLQEAEQARQAALAQQQALSQQAEQARLQAQQAEQARIQAQQQAEQQRQRLLTQLNQVLQTRDTARGLIVNMSDVLFDLNKATLRSGAKLRLAKVAGIILAYPDLKLEIDGFTDNTGSPTYNQTLSDKRAETVKNFLAAQGVSSNNIVTRGYGESNPVASNSTAAGRQMNRRVELVVSGTAIGTNINSSTTTTTTTTGTPAGTSAPAQSTQAPGASATGAVGSSGIAGSAGTTGTAGTSSSPAGTPPPAAPGAGVSGTVNTTTTPSTPANAPATAQPGTTSTTPASQPPAGTASQPATPPPVANPAPAATPPPGTPLR